MSPKSTSKPRLAFARVLLCGLLFIFASRSNICAKTMETIQLFFPGNFSGNAVYLTESSEPLPGSCWKAPSLLLPLLRKDKTLNLVIGIGNDSSIFSIPSFLTDGQVEREIISQCACNSESVGSEDLQVFRNRLLSSQIRERVLTNIEPEDGFSIFKPYNLMTVKNTRFWHFNFLGLAGFKQLPLQKWGKIKPEDPSRSIRRMNPQFESSDVTVSTAHMGRKECLNLAQELNKHPGIHLLVQIPPGSSRPEFSCIEPERHGKVFIFSVRNGWERLAMLKVFRRNFGYPRLSLRMLPYEKAETGSSLRDFSRVRKMLGEELYATLNLVPTTIKPSTAPFRFHPDLHAKFAKAYMKTDVSIIKIPEESFKLDNVVSVVNCLSAIGNEKLFRFRISGRELEKLINGIINSSTKPLPNLSGCSFNIFAGKATNILVGKFELRPEKSYNVSINMGLLRDPGLGKLFPMEKLEPFEGTTLWDVWKSQLKSLKIERDHFNEL